MVRILAEPYADAMVGRLVMPVILLGLAGVLGFFAVQNANRYYEANYPPDDAETMTATVLAVETEDVCGQTSRSTRRCTTEVHGLDVRLPDGETVSTDAHAVFSIGDEVTAFQDSDGDWQVEDSFTTGWVARTFGFTAAGALILLVLGLLALREALRPKKAGPAAHTDDAGDAEGASSSG